MPDPVLLSGGGLQIRFQFVDDRFAHKIAAVDGERIVPLAASCEGTPQEEWPASPALQEINTQSPGERPMAMLMGQTVQGYWSVTVELDPQTGQAVFDVACRVKSAPRLTSGYRTVVAPTTRPTGSLELSLGEISVEIETLPTPVVAGLPDLEAAELTVDGEGWRISPRNLPHEYPETVRWRYAVRRLK